MISRARHRISLVAIGILALVAGVLAATFGLPDRVADAAAGADDAQTAQIRELTAERDGLAARADAGDRFAAGVGPGVVRGKLTGVPVTLVTVGGDPAGTDADTTAVADLVTAAGGSVAGRVRLTDAVTDPAKADQLRDLSARLLPAGAQLPATSESGTLAGGLLGSVLLTPAEGPAPDPGQAQAVLAGLAGAGFAEAPAAPPAPGRLAVVVTGGAAQGVDAGASAASLARMATELDRHGGTVLAGRSGSAVPDGPVGAARTDDANSAGLSTVDDVDTASGRIATVLALGEQKDGRSGRYGSGPGAAGPVPALG
ncbi:copper transporter [Pseudonocardia phyllosphaerae]|uniref:copper transporter n=1 Tax=Pseudonocardia phyllosphaerae TaxID=3390502 RepID=UPI00397AFE9B